MFRLTAFAAAALLTQTVMWYISSQRCVDTQGGPKNGATLYFPEYLGNYHRYDVLHTAVELKKRLKYCDQDFTK